MILSTLPSTEALPRGRTEPPAVPAPLHEAEVVAAAQRMQFGQGATGTVTLLRLLAGPSLTSDELAGHIGTEPLLAMRVLRVANSAFYGQAGRVATLGRAAQVLGVQALRGIALAACFDGLSTRQPGTSNPNMAAFRLHSLATACAAQALARTLAPELTEQAFLAGLLHDIGLLLLWRLRPDTACTDAHHSVTAGLGHADCGRVLMQTWSLPEALTLAVAEHETMVVPATDPLPASEAGWTLAALLALAEALTSQAGFGMPGDADRRVPAPGEPLHEACAIAAAEFPAAARPLIAELCA